MATVTTKEGIGAATARKLKKVGIGSTEKLHEVNDAKKITRRLPSDEQVVGWIKAAGRLEPMVSH